MRRENIFHGTRIGCVPVFKTGDAIGHVFGNVIGPGGKDHGVALGQRFLKVGR